MLWDTGTDQKEKAMKVALVPANRSNYGTVGHWDTRKKFVSQNKSARACAPGTLGQTKRRRQ